MVARNQEELADILNVQNNLTVPYPVDVVITEHTGLLDCYAVFWIWMRHISLTLKEKWPMEYSSLDHEGQVMHDVVCQMFLGYTNPVKVGKTLVDRRPRTLTSPKLTKGELIDLLRRIEEWCIGTLGITLPAPPSEYTQHG